MIGVFLVDDHELVRRGLADLIGRTAGMEVVGEAATAQQTLKRVEACRPDIVVLDLRLPDGNGIELCRDIRSRMSIPCIILTAFDDDHAVHAAILAGAGAYSLKTVTGSRLIEDIRAVSAGKTRLNASRLPALHDRRASESDDPRVGALGIRERQVLDGIARGLTNRQIGSDLGIAEKTVKNYVSSLLMKLGMTSRTQAALFQRDQHL
ncbi:response regulator transcription factor [Microbacterium sp. SL62]|uniref:response regulator n=1 Tax=Microbacterium sp. SL62 TaxID=2995139 RepID=UPI002274990B|nr:response regulator transcription factor [Microbacterium sp. SL62]MCY1718619.1 response regulator transcription factor [Microbacterium sp. SL62]